MSGIENNPLTNWRIGLRAGTGGSTTTEVWFDNVVVTQLPDTTSAPANTPTPTPTPTPTNTPTPTPSGVPTGSPTPTLPSLNVPDLKQYTGGWENIIYDHTLKTIKEWGCALTSASMILQYHGHNIFPDGLNDWLKLQLDGYIRNSLINWLAVSRYTFLNKSVSSPALEYKRLNPTDTNLINELENNRPAILKVPGHFIVAKSQTSDSFGINDPGYSDRFTLDSYSNTFSALNTYLPTNTNLSYLLLVLNYDNNLKVYDPSGNEIVGFTFTEEFLSGETLKIFQYPTPTIGKYRVEITGTDTPFKLESYFYNQDGNLIDNQIITTEGNLPTALDLNYDTNPDTSHIEVLPAIISNQSSTTPSASSAIITWTTNRQTSSRVVYDTLSHPTVGSAPNYGYAYSTSTFDINPKVLSHSITISDLSSNTVYYYRTVSTGSPTAISEEKTFRTLSIAGPPASTGSTEQTTKTVAKTLGKNTVMQIQKMQENKEVLGEKSESQNEILVKNSFVKENKNSFISIFLLLFGICYLQIMKPITGRH